MILYTQRDVADVADVADVGTSAVSNWLHRQAIGKLPGDPTPEPFAHVGESARVPVWDADGLVLWVAWHSNR